MATQNNERPLSDRESTVLHYVVHDFIETATPIGSRFISKRHEDELGLSSASIRNVMSDLEYMGYINHPHTSAGRVPTDLGYRYYLDNLMKMESLPTEQQEDIKRGLDAAEERESILHETSKVLSKISRQLCVVTSPQLSAGTIEKMEMIQVSSNRVMVIISIKSGLVQTIMMEVSSAIPREKLDYTARLLNEKLAGLTIKEVKETFVERLKDTQGEDMGLIRLFVDSVDKLFLRNRSEKLHISGTESILDQPEFVNPSEFRGIIELISNEEIIIHVLEKQEGKPKEIRVSIGSENDDEKLSQYGVITSMYTVGDISGSIGVIGPKRMHYSKMIPLVDYVAKTISQMFDNSNRI
ncbi:MAG TPA: heat-inducible transcriptional repressor HrcA [Bacteroidota bacterium]